ncbi:MAG: hypothetical protein AB1505_31445 [Candidatus Latescibacterota bacterium]
MQKPWSALLVMVVGLGGPPSAGSEDVSLVVRRLQDRVNEGAGASLLAPVDYEFAHVRAPRPGVVLLDSAAATAIGRTDTVAQETEVVVRRDSTRLPDGGDSVFVATEERVREIGPAASPEEEAWRALPDDLRHADLAALQAMLGPPPAAGWRLAVLEHRPDSTKDLTERTTLAETELTLMERRVLHWKLRQLRQQWPGGSQLFLGCPDCTVDDDPASVPVRWSVRRRGPPPFDKPDIVASGELTLVLKKTGAERRVSHVEELIGTLYGAVAGQ